MDKNIFFASAYRTKPLGPAPFSPGRVKTTLAYQGEDPQQKAFGANAQQQEKKHSALAGVWIAQSITSGGP
jgi:hypothetical protein